jgi:hypothetical protein
MRDHEPSDPEPALEETWGQRLRGFFEALGSLLSTRAAIFREELGASAATLGSAIGAFVLAAALALIALLLLTAGIAALLSRLLGGPIAGILATFVLYAAAAGLAATLGVKALKRVNFEFPVTREEVRKDWQALQASASPRPPEPSGGEGETAYHGRQLSSDDLEARFRAGSE